MIQVGFFLLLVLFLFFDAGVRADGGNWKGFSEIYRILSALYKGLEFMGSVASTDVAAHNCLIRFLGGFNALFWPPWAPRHTWSAHTHTYYKHAYT